MRAPLQIARICLQRRLAHHPTAGTALPAVAFLASALALAGLTSLGASSGKAAEGDTLRYALCEQNVAILEVLPGRADGTVFGVAVKLERPAAETFAQLTNARVGSILEVVFAQWVFVRARIESRISSGLIVNRSFSSQADAQRALGKLRSELPEQPCGLVPQTRESTSIGSRTPPASTTRR